MNNALAQYAELQQQTADADPMELDTARQAIRSDKEHEVMQQLQNTYGKRFDSGTLAQSRKDINKMLDETVEPTSIQNKLQQASEQLSNSRQTKKREQER